MYLAWRNLLQDKTRFALSVGGVALAIMLVLVLNGFLTGLYQQMSAYLDNQSASVVIASPDANSLMTSTSPLPRGTIDAVRKVDGVVAVIPIFAQFIYIDLHEKRVMVYLIGYDPTIGGGPWRLVAGREPTADNEIVVDRVLAQRHGFQVGDTFSVMGIHLSVVGLADGTSSWLTSYVFIRQSAIAAFMLNNDLTNFLLVTPAPGVTPETLRERLHAALGVNALLKSDAIANDAKLFAGVFSAPLRLMITIAFVVGTLVVGLIIYTNTVERQAEFGVLKAVGAKNGLLYRIVLSQAFIAAGIGVAVSIGLALLVAQIIMALRPEFLVAFDVGAIIVATVAGLVMALPAALVPARMVAQLSPAEVLRR